MMIPSKACRIRQPSSSSSIFLSLLLLLLASFLPSSHATGISCQTDLECEETLGTSSVCKSNKCTNPYYNRGCLANALPGWKRTRVCSSDDPPEAQELGYCRPPPFDNFMEVRIQSQNWESGFFGTWILQIVLSELLDVPVSVETGVQDLNVNLYNESSAMEYGVGYDWPSIRQGYATGDCRLLQEEGGDDYKTCAHVIPEMWQEGQDRAREVIDAGIAKPLDLGILAGQYWFVPRFTAERYPEFLTHNGLQGEENRRRLAEIFKRPTTWKQYCEEVSLDGCATDDGVAKRAPETPEEEEEMFVQGQYIGHFRKTAKNDCSNNATQCSGHYFDYPCGWTTYARQQAHHLGIGMEPTVYTYNQMVGIWHAANATKSDVMGFWWHPEAVFETYFGTDAEHTRVTLTRPSQTCYDNRIDPLERCGDDIDKLIGSPLGSCDTAPQALTKILVGNLKELLEDPDVDEELWSPAYGVLENYRIGTLQLQDIFSAWNEIGRDKWNFDSREATCQWVVENLELVRSFIPPTHPRVLSERDTTEETLFVTALVCAAIALLTVSTSTVLVYKNRRAAVLNNAQMEVLYLLHAGFAIVAVASMVLALPISDTTCMLYPWLYNLGISLVLAPIAIKIDAINRSVTAGKQMQRVRLSPKVLFGTVYLMLVVVAAFCLVWTIVDPSQETSTFDVSDNPNGDGEYLLVASSHCASSSTMWITMSYTWPAVLCLYSLMFVFMANRGTKEDVNGTKSLGVLVTVQLVFAVVRIVTLSIRGADSDPTNRMGYESLYLSCDCILALLVFIGPKLLERGKQQSSDEHLPDLFLHTSIMYADIVGFVGWSSVREPAQVFKFLEAVYGEMDDIGGKHKVFKVETVAQTYVAATGIPTPQKQHALILANFALECVRSFDTLTNELEVVFGPDTGDLSLRAGIHSGAVTGGFLRGKGARFQLFGDTANTAHEIALTGMPGLVQVSEHTAVALRKAGKADWLHQREDTIFTKGHGQMKAYWLRNHGMGISGKNGSTTMGSMRTTEMSSSVSLSSLEEAHQTKARQLASQQRKQRLIAWNVEVLHKHLKQIVSRRHAAESVSGPLTKERRTSYPSMADFSPVRMPLDEVKEIIFLPEFDKQIAKRMQDSGDVGVGKAVVDQLTKYVTQIANLYQDNHFHSFAHASHVVMAVLKYLNRIVAAADQQIEDNNRSSVSQKAAGMHSFTNGISSDPLTHFACCFSALIHDVDHRGVPNDKLIEEQPQMAKKYLNRSVAEQNSLDLAWNLLQETEYRDLRLCICGDNLEEEKRFRELVTNAVLCTDLGDQELKALRNNRWKVAFSEGKDKLKLNPQKSSNRKATIVIEHLIQASDVSHTMQHWDIYREWNENLFNELYDAYRLGRAAKDPSQFWYEGEIGFFDFYIIPLSKKLDECGVFGICSDENLNYALTNRELWLKEGKQVTADMLTKARLRWEKKALDIGVEVEMARSRSPLDTQIQQPQPVRDLDDDWGNMCVEFDDEDVADYEYRRHGGTSTAA